MASILVVDDEVVIRELFSIWLEETGHQVRAAGSVAAARELLDAAPADVLVSDVRMAQSTGIDLLNWAVEHAPGMPVVLVTGRPAVETAVDALRIGAYDYLVKPVDQPDLLRVVERAYNHCRLLREKQRLEVENQRYRRQLEESVSSRTDALKRRNQQLLLINEVSAALNAARDLQELYVRTVESIHQTFGYADASLFSVDERSQRFRLEAMATEAEGGPVVAGYEQPLDAGLLGVVYRDGDPHVSNDVSRETSFVAVPGRSDIVAEAILPVRVDDKIVALLAVSESRPDAFDDVDQMVLRTLAEHLGVAVANARLYTRLADALEAREQMLANVSHELRSPLSVISAWAEMLSDGTLGVLEEDPHQASENILVSAHHLTHLVDLLLTFQRLDREEMPMSRVVIPQLLHEAAVSWRPILERDGLGLELSVDEDVAPVIGSIDYLRQVLNNLFDNARKFSPDGGCARVYAAQRDGRVLVSVVDEGVGVPPEKLERLFERFYQADGGMTRRFEGMGLGLSLSHEIIRRHGGSIWAVSEGEGKGLTISFSLPVAGPNSGEFAELPDILG